MTEQRFNHKIPRRTFLKVCAAAAAAGLTACGKTQAAAALPELTVGSDNYPPFIYLNNDSTPTGIDVDIATEAFARIGYVYGLKSLTGSRKPIWWKVVPSTASGAAFPWMGGSSCTAG